MIYNKTELRKIANNLKKELNKLPQIDDNGVYEVAKKLGLDCNSYEDNYWYLSIDNEKPCIFSGRITKTDILGKEDKELLSWYKGSKVVEDSIIFNIDVTDDTNSITCYVTVDVWYKYPVYNENKEVLLFEIDL